MVEGGQEHKVETKEEQRSQVVRAVQRRCRHGADFDFVLCLFNGTFGQWNITSYRLSTANAVDDWARCRVLLHLAEPWSARASVSSNAASGRW